MYFSGLVLAVPSAQTQACPCGTAGPSRRAVTSGAPSLDLSEVKRIAAEEGCKLISQSDASRVVSFRKGEGVRINVYWTTGTVGTCLDHPVRGKTQLFRRNMNYSMLRDIFRNPRAHTGHGYYRREQIQGSGRSSPGICLPNFNSRLRVGDRVHVRGYTNGTIESNVLLNGPYRGRLLIRYDDGQSYHTKPEELVEATSALDDRECQGLETEVKKQIQQLDAEIAKMQADRDGLAHILNEINNEREMERQRQVALEAARIAEQKRRAEAEAEAERAKRRRIEKERKETERSDRGKYIDFNLHESDYVQQNFGKTVTSMAMGGTATVMLYEDGDWMYTAGLPKLLHNKLKGRAKHHPSPVYVAVGSQDRYYIKFSNGKSEWVGCDDLTEELNSSSSSKVKSVAFGEEWDSYFVVYTDGGYAYQSVPSELVKLIKKRIKADLSCVSLGPDGEYYVGAEDGRAWWGGMHADNLSIAGKVKDRIKFMDFGDDDSFFVRYS